MLARLVAIALPWLALIAPAGAVSVGLHAIAIIAAFHGWGLAIARACRRDPGAWLAIAWGLAGVVALAGLAIALGVYTARVQWAIVLLGLVIHSGVLAMRLRAPSPRWPMLPALLVAALAVVHVLGAAGDVGARPFDDDGNLLGQIARLLDTGGLADGIGYPRTSQLGGHAALASLAAIAGDLRFARMIDALGLAVFLALACARIRVRDAATGIWACLLIVTVSALPIAHAEATPMWLVAALALALFATLEDATDDPRSAIPVALVAGALVALRTELAPIAVVAIAGAWWERRGRMLLALAGIALVVVAPYALARQLAEPIASGGSTVARAAGVVAIAVPASALLLLPFGGDRSRAQRSAAWATAAGLAGVALSGGYASQFLWPIALAYIAKLVVELARGDAAPPATAFVVALLAAVWIYDGRDTAGRARWSHRYSDLVFGIDYLHGVGDRAPAGGSYDRALAAIPDGATVAVWVARPEQLDYHAHAIVDLRTPRWAHLRKPDDAHHELAALIAKTGADYLVVEHDDAPPGDDLDIALRDDPLVIVAGLVRVVKLTAR
jgi:hypothetical protein